MKLIQHAKTQNIALIMLLSCIIYGIHFMFFHGGYFGFDDIEYCRLANNLINGNFSHDSLYAHRYSSILPISFSYLVFGVGDFANFTAGFLIFLITLFLILKALKGLDISQQWIAALLLIFAPMYLMYIEKPMPDIVVALGFTLSFLSYFSIRFDLSLFRNNASWFSIGVIIMLLAKETFLIFYPFFVGLMIIDFINKNHRTFWKNVALSLSIFGVGFIIYSYFFLGDALARIHHIFEGQYLSDCSYDKLPLSATLQRIGYQFWFELVRNGFLIPLCFVPILLKNDDAKQKFVAIGFIALLLLANFMTISYTSYIPLCPDPRHHIYILPLGVMVAAYGAGHLSKLSLTNIISSLTILGLILFISVYNSYEHKWWTYLPLMLGFIAAYKQQKNWMIGLISISMLNIYVQNCIYNKKTNYADQKLLNEHVISVIPGFKYVITDKVNSNYGLLNSSFDTTAVQFVDFRKSDTFNFKSNVPQFLIMNGMTTYLSNTSWDDLPEFAKTAHEQLQKVYENKSGAVYKLK